jgi:hypothetical protein
MAKAEFRMPSEFLDRLSRLGERTDEIIPRVLEAGGEVVLNQVRSNLNAVLSGNSTGELASSLGLSPAKIDKNGNYNVKVGFDEPRPDGKSNAMIANVIEFGKHGQLPQRLSAPRPFLKPAKSASRAPCIEAMKRKLEEEMGDV